MLDLTMDKLKLVLVLLAAKTLIGTALTVLLLKTSGAVFGSQAGYVVTFSGIAWSLGLLDETLPLMAWVALGMMLVGLILVEPKDEVEARPERVDCVGNQHYTAITGAGIRNSSSAAMTNVLRTGRSGISVPPDIHL